MRIKKHKGLWTILLCATAWIGLTACIPRPLPDPAFCEAQVAYTKDGTVDTSAYQVSRACLRWMNARLDACNKN